MDSELKRTRVLILSTFMVFKLSKANRRRLVPNVFIYSHVKKTRPKNFQRI